MKQGFTLLELLVSVAILATVSTLIVTVLFTTLHANTKSDVLSKVKENGEFSLDVMSRLVRSTTANQTFCFAGETATPAAVFTNFDGGQTTLTCISDGVSARIASVSGTGVVSYLSAPTVSVSNSSGADCGDSSLFFSCPDSTGLSSPITISFTLGSVGGSAYDTVRTSFQGTATPRNY